MFLGEMIAKLNTKYCISLHNKELIHNLLYVSLEILVRTPLKNQLDLENWTQLLLEGKKSGPSLTEFSESVRGNYEKYYCTKKNSYFLIKLGISGRKI